jgi:hypothetical protein
MLNNFPQRDDPFCNTKTFVRDETLLNLIAAGIAVADLFYFKYNRLYDFIPSTSIRPETAGCGTITEAGDGRDGPATLAQGAKELLNINMLENIVPTHGKPSRPQLYPQVCPQRISLSEIERS